MNSLWRKSLWMAGVSWRLVLKELRQNFVVYLSLLIFFLPIAILSWISGKPVPLGAKASIIALIIAFIYSVIYGLQGFAGETDRKTIDFLLSRPIPPTLLIGVKFLLNIGVYLFWLLIIARRITLDWSLLHFPPNVNGNMIGLIFPIIMSMGFFSGLIARGAERLVITVGLTGLMAGGCYLIWNQAFLLMSADYYWFDIPPHIVTLISIKLPILLLMVSLATPLVFSNWFLRGRYTFYRFKPLRRLASVWVTIAMVIWIAVIFMGPAIWPLSTNPRGGDWHPRSGVVIAGTYFKPKYPLSSLYLARIGGKPHQIYKGSQVHSARWSPDGKSIVFVDGPWIKIWQRTGVKKIIKGSFPCWSHDGKSLAFVQNPDKRQEFKGIYVINLKNKSVRLLYASPRLEILGVAWDSLRDHVFLIYEKKLDGYLKVVNLKKLKEDTIKISTPPPAFYLQNPSITIGPAGKLILATTFEHQIHLSVISAGEISLSPLDDIRSRAFDQLSQTILSPSGEGYLVPRMDGAYEYKGFVIGHDHHDGDDDEEKAH